MSCNLNKINLRSDLFLTPRVKTEILQKIFKSADNLQHFLIKYPTLLEDFELAKDVLNTNGHSLYYFPKELCENIDLARTAVLENVDSMAWVGENLKSDKTFVMEMIQAQGGRVFDHAPQFHSDESVISEAVKTYPWALSKADKSLQNNPYFILKLLEQSKNTAHLERIFSFAGKAIKHICKDSTHPQIALRSHLERGKLKTIYNDNTKTIPEAL